MLVDVLWQLDICAILGQVDGRVHADRASPQVHIRINIACEILASDLLVNLHENLCKVAPVLIYPPLLHF